MTKKTLNQNGKYVHKFKDFIEPDYIFSNKPINRFKIFDDENYKAKLNKSDQLSDLKDKINTIENCNLRINSNKLVMGEGKINSPLMLIGESVQYYFENKYKEPQQFLILNYWNSSWAKHQSLNTLLEQSVNNEDHRIVFISTEDNKKNYLKLIENEKNFQFKEIDTKKFRNNNISVEVIIFSYKKIKNE